MTDTSSNIARRNRVSPAGSTSKEAPDFENPKDMNGDNVYEIVINVFDTDNAQGPEGREDNRPERE